MSHIVQVKVEFSDVDALRSACQALDVELGGAGTVRYFYESTGREDNRADFVIKLPGRYDVGFRQQSDGSLTVICDSEAMSGGYGRGDDARRLLGEDLSLLKQEYAAARLAGLAHGQGHLFTRGERQRDGSFVVSIQG